MAHLARLMAVLEQPPPAQDVQVTPFGRLQPPLGFERYKAVQVVAALLRTDDPTAAAGAPAVSHGLQPPAPASWPRNQAHPREQRSPSPRDRGAGPKP